MKRFAVIGLGQFGRHLAVSLTQLGAQVLAIDREISSVEALRDRVAQAVAMDATNEAELANAGVTDVDAVVVAMAEDLQASVLITALLVKLHVPRVIARASSDLHATILQSIGATRVINPEKEYAYNVAHEIEQPNFQSRMTLETGHRVVEIESGHALWGKTLQELDFRKHYRLNVIAIRRRINTIGRHGETETADEINDLPAGGDRIEKGDVLVVLGSERNLGRFEEEMS